MDEENLFLKDIYLKMFKSHYTFYQMDMKT